MHAEGKQADPHLLMIALRADGKLQEIGFDYVPKIDSTQAMVYNIEEYCKELKENAKQRDIQSLKDQFINEIQSGNCNQEERIKKFVIDANSIIGKNSAITIMKMDERLDRHDNFLSTLRGKEYIGLRQKTIPKLDEMLLGLRRLILLAAEPNIGKTALTLQLGLDVVEHQKNACMVYFSLEMSHDEMLTRTRCYFSDMDFRTFVRGSATIFPASDALFTKEELDKIEKANANLKEIGLRIQILDSSMCPNINARKAIAFINEVKQKTNCDRVIVIIDYLQQWPLTERLPVNTELELDKWRIGEMKQIRDAIGDDPIIVISEARKPSGDSPETWARDKSDIMGSARNLYTPDVLMMYYPTHLSEVLKKWEDSHLKLSDAPFVATSKNSIDKQKLDCLNRILAKKGMALYTVSIEKGRDGMDKGQIQLLYHYKKNRFEPQPEWPVLLQQFEHDYGQSETVNTKNPPLMAAKNWRKRQ